MYQYIEGKLVERNPAYAVLDCHGVAYFIHISLNTYSGLPEGLSEGAVVRLYIHLVVREDDMMMYGFHTTDERELFRQLITVSGIGVNTARMILSSLSPEGATEAIYSEDVARLQSIKGIGGKTAQRIILDLKGKLPRLAGDGRNLSPAYNSKNEEALSALLMLGFGKSQTEKALKKIIGDGKFDMGIEEIIKEALKIL